MLIRWLGLNVFQTFSIKLKLFTNVCTLQDQFTQTHLSKFPVFSIYADNFSSTYLTDVPSSPVKEMNRVLFVGLNLLKDYASKQTHKQTIKAVEQL